MTTTWKSDDRNNKKETNQKSAQPADNSMITAATLSSWSRQQKLAMMAGFGILGGVLIISACSKQSPKPALEGVSKPAPAATVPAPANAAVASAASPAEPAAVPEKKARRKRPANVTYTDATSGVSFLYPRKFALTTGDKGRPQFAPLGDAVMNFVQPGGVTVATVEFPSGSYPGTDFASAFFNVNLNRSVSQEECGHFAFVDSHNVNGAPVDAGKAKVGEEELATTANFSASALTQTETQYYHSYENGACYEYILSVGTAGYGTNDAVTPVNRDEVFARLDKILATVKIKPVEPEHVAEQVVTGETVSK